MINRTRYPDIKISPIHSNHPSTTIDRGHVPTPVSQNVVELQSWEDSAPPIDAHIVTREAGAGPANDQMMKQVQSEEMGATNKPFKKLASLLDNLLETARNTTLMQDSANGDTSVGTSAASRRRKRNGNPNLMNDEM